MNFTGERIKKEKILDVAFTVSDYMTENLIFFNENDSLRKTLEKLVENKITGGPVVNNNNELVGMISETDFIKCVSDSRYFNMPWGNEKLSSLMSRTIETINANDTIFDAVNQFSISTKKRFPVLKEGKLVGQLNQHDVLLAALRINSGKW